LKLLLTSLEDIIASLREKLSITSPFTVQYYDEDVKMYVLLENVEDLPKEGIKFKVITRALSWPPMQLGSRKDMSPLRINRCW